MKKIENIILKLGVLVLVAGAAVRRNNAVSSILALVGLVMLLVGTLLSLREYIAKGKSEGNVRTSGFVFYIVCILAIICVSVLIVKNRF